MMLRALMAGLAVEPVGGGAAGAEDVRVCDITEDSRTAMPGSLFIARRGEKSDGRAFVRQAVEAGAVAVLTDDAGVTAAGVPVLVAGDLPLVAAQAAERFYGEPSRKLALVGVTGTNGKTTVTYLVHQLLNRAGMRCGLVGTVCVDDGVEVAPAVLTTPPSLELSRTFARMAEAGCVAAALEASSHALHQRRVGALAFRVGVFTNLSHDHLDYHKTMEAYAEAKAMLFAALPADGVAVINADDPAAEGMLRGAGGCRARVVRCTMRSRRDAAGPAPEAAARVVSATASATTIEVLGPWDTAPGARPWRVRLPLIGAHNVMNALQAACAAWAAGLDAGAVLEGLEHVHAPPGRLEPVTGAEDPIAVYVDYAHSDDSLRRVLAVMREVVGGGKGGKVHVVFGCGGDRDRTKRPKMGAVAAELGDRVIVTSDNPRTEEPRAIIDEVMRGIAAGARGKTVVEPDRERAIHMAVSAAAPGDIVLVAGKGHEDYQILPDGRGGTRKVHFDDREVARAALAARGIKTSGAAEAAHRARAAAGGGVRTPTRHERAAHRPR